MSDIDPNHRPNILYQLEDKIPARTAALVAFQHVMAMFIGVITMPLVVSHALKFNVGDTAYLVSMGLFISGISTCIQTGGIGPVGSRLLAIQGTSFAFLKPLIQAGSAGGMPLMIGMALVCAPVEGILSIYLPKLRRVFTPVVTGIVVLLIGASLVPVGMRSIASGLNASAPPWAGVAIAAFVLGVVLAFNGLRRPWARMAAVPVALGVGCLICYSLGYLKPVAVEAVDQASWIVLPIPFKYGLAFRWEFLLPFLFVYTITTLETIGDITATSQLSLQPIEGPAYWKRVRGGVLADSVNSLLAAVFNTFPNTTFAQNNGVIQLTGVASRRVGYWVGGFLSLLGLFPVIGRAIALIPGPVLGAVTLLLFGMVATAGVRILQQVTLNHRNLLIVATSLSLGLGVEAVPQVLEPLPEVLKLIFASAITTGGFAALVLNTLMPHDEPQTLPLASAEVTENPQTAISGS
ncbi:MAG TPA: nucleobase:cation symporter-2 family protein [Chthoniobacterales bacterium]